MTANLKTPLIAGIEAAATKAGLALVSPEQGSSAAGPTALFDFALPGEAAGRALKLELSANFDLGKPELLPEIEKHLANEAKRLRNPHPRCYITLAGIPVEFRGFQWPPHRATSGSDVYVVHGEVRLADGGAQNLTAKVAAAITLTFADVVPAMEQPYSESFVYNAVRKTMDMGQLELLKSGNRQPVPVTMRFFSRWQNRFFFTETDDVQRLQYLLRKVYWLSGVLGEGKPVWIADPRDAMYLNAEAADLLRVAGQEAVQSLMTVEGEFASATPKLMARAAEYREQLEKALEFTKPKFNEAMRSGHSNL